MFAHITEGSVADVSVAQQLMLPPGSIVAIDRGYRLFEVWCEQKVGFVTRLMSNAEYFYVKHGPRSKEGLIRADDLIQFQVFTAGRTIWNTYRRVEVWVEEKQQTLVLLTNLRHLSASTIAAYKFEANVRPLGPSVRPTTRRNDQGRQRTPLLRSGFADDVRACPLTGRGEQRSTNQDPRENVCKAPEDHSPYGKA